MQSSYKLSTGQLYKKVDTYVYVIYKLTKKFPSEEKFGLTSQLRRSSLSVMLNYIEGYARFRTKVFINFLEISYGSLKESQYLLEFAKRETWIEKIEYEDIYSLGDEIGAMLWKTMSKINS